MLAAMLAAGGSGGVFAQKLIVNGDFEVYNGCPPNLGAIGTSINYGRWPSVTDWANPSRISTPDYLHSCAPRAAASTPSNSIGYAIPRSGKAYAGILTYSTIANEYITTRLSRPLVRDSIYEMQFYTCPAGQGQISQGLNPPLVIGVGEIGAHFSDTAIWRLRDIVVDLPYHIVSSTQTAMTDTTLWYEVSGRYTAKGGERWVTIGRFSKSDTLVPPYGRIRPGDSSIKSGYNYIDDVSLLPVAKKGVPTNVPSRLLSQVRPAPNPVTGMLRLDGAPAYAGPMTATVTSVTGAVCLERDLTAGDRSIDLVSLPSGTYFLRVSIPGDAAIFRIVRQ